MKSENTTNIIFTCLGLALFTILIIVILDWQNQVNNLSVSKTNLEKPTVTTYSAYQNLVGEGYLDLKSGNDLVTLSQADVRYALASHNHFGQTWIGSTIGLTITSDTIGLSANGSESGVWGQSDTTSGQGIHGYTSSDSGITYGVYGKSASTEGRGVYGYTNTANGTTYGVFGESASSDGRGVYGVATAPRGPTIGIYGTSTSLEGYGVYGITTNSYGVNIGVYGQARSSRGFGVYGSAPITGTVGIATSFYGVTFGIYGQMNSDRGSGVYGYAANTSGKGIGVYGRSAATDGAGVFGIANSKTGTTTGVLGYGLSTHSYGVMGVTLSSVGTTYGVYGFSHSTEGTGVYGYTDNSNGITAGVVGRSEAFHGFGVAGTSDNIGVGVAAWSDSGNLIEAYSGRYPKGTLRFLIDRLGNIYTDGVVNSFIPSTYDGTTHAVASIQSPEVWLEDFGHARLVRGEVVVTISHDFTELANLSTDYMVFLTPEGDSRGLYVADKAPTYFEVMEQRGGKSNVEFSYRIVAKRTGQENVRLPKETTLFPVDPHQQPSP